jgi:hypothetical protein
MSRLAMNAAQMGGAAVAGGVVAATGPGWALAICGTGMLGTVPLLLSIRARPSVAHDGATRGDAATSMIREILEGWEEFRSHTWLWVIVAQYCIVMMAWYGAFTVLGPVVAKQHLGGPAAWGAITAAESVGLVAGGLVSLRYGPRRPMLFVAGIGIITALSPLSLAMLWPLPAVCLATFAEAVTVEVMMVQWTVALARNIPPGKLARVAAYDALGSVMAMPLGALAAGPLAAALGVSSTQYLAAALITAISLLALLPHDVRMVRSPDSRDATGEPAPVTSP